MLNRIFITNFALIDSLEISLNKGLQVITGETGAGKSIILGALRLILGERADVKSIQNASAKSIVEAEFTVNESLKPFFEVHDLDFELQTIVRREIMLSGKSRAFVNDVPVTLDVLKSLTARLVDIHSQFETSHLFNEDYQFRIMDGLSGNATLITEYRSDFQEYKRLKQVLSRSITALEEQNRETDYKQFLLQELADMNLDDFDLEEVQNQLKKHENAELITDTLHEIFARLDAEEIGILDTLNDLKNKVGKVSELSHEFSELNTRLNETLVEFKDIIFELHNESEKIDIDPESLQQLQEKVNAIQSLFLKHHVNSVDELIAIRDTLQAEQAGFDGLKDLIADTEKEIDATVQSLTAQAALLAENRRKAVPVFKDKMESLLRKLGLPKAKIEVELKDTEDFNHFGKEGIQFLFQANAGFPLKPVQEAISGGERSRVMLSVKKIMAENAELPTLILDEIDTGVSGKVAEEIGNLMREMSADTQLIVITHLAQVAAKGDDHFKVQKDEAAGKTQTRIVHLNEEQKLLEVAQLLSGSQITDAAILQARELMK